MGNICESAINVFIIPLYQSKEHSKQTNQLFQHKCHHFTISLDYGQINHESVDAILLTTDIDLQLTKFQSKGFTDKQLKALSNQLQILKLSQNYNYGDVIHTTPQDLSFDYVFFCVMPNDAQQQKQRKQFIYDSIAKSLQLGQELDIKSIAFPFLKCSNVSISQVSEMMLVPLKQFIEENKRLSKANFNMVRFCLDDESQKDQFLWTLNQIFETKDNLSQNIRSDNKKLTSQCFEMNEMKQEENEDDFLFNFGKSYKEKCQGQMEIRKNSL